MIDPADPDFTDLPATSGRPTFPYCPVGSVPCPAVSILTSFQHGRRHGDVVSSVLGQSLQEWEWLVIPPTTSGADCQRALGDLAARDGRVRLLPGTPEETAWQARNRLAAASQAGQLLFLGEDDLLEPTAIEKWLWAADCDPALGLVNSRHVCVGERQNLVDVDFKTPGVLLGPPPSTDTFLIRRECFVAAGGYDTSLPSWTVVWDFWLRCAAAGYRACTIPEYLVWHRGSAAMPPAPAEIEAFGARNRSVYPGLSPGSFPVAPREIRASGRIPQGAPCANLLAKSRRRLLLIHRSLVTGGAERAALDIVSQLIRRDWDVTVVATADAEHTWHAEFARRSPDVFVLEHFLGTRPGVPPFPEDYPRFLHYLIASRNIDAVVLCNSRLGLAALPYLRACFPEVAFLALHHAAFWPFYALDAYPLLDLTIASSACVRDEIVGVHGVPAEGVAAYHTNVDAARWRPDSTARREIRANLGIDPMLPVLAYVARLVDDKQPQVFADVVRRLRDQQIPCAAVVVGEGPRADWLKAFATEHRLHEHLHLLGHVSDARLPRVLAASDLFFLPSRMEGISIAAFEAMACGLPVVSAAIGGMAELVTPDCGVLIPPGAPATETNHYTEVVAGLLGDRAQLIALGRAARQRIVDHFRLEQMGERFESLIDQAIKRKRASRREPSAVEVGRAALMAGVSGEYFEHSREQVVQWALREQSRVAELRSRVAELEAQLTARAAWEAASAPI